MSVDAHRRVVHGVLQVREEIQLSKDVAGGICRCRRCGQQLVPIFVISLSRKMNRYMVGAVLNTQTHTTRVQHTPKGVDDIITSCKVTPAL